jgi:hypothetical protein
MHRALLASFLFALAAAHAIGGALNADADSATLLLVGASATTRWIATQLLGGSIAGYSLAGFATLGILAPTSWRTAAIVAGAASSLLLVGMAR